MDPTVNSATAPVAGPGQRLGAWILDAAVLGLVSIPFNPLLYSDEPSAGLFFALFAPAMVFAFVYLVRFDGGPRGATPGKRIVGIRVVDAASGDAIGYRRATIRRFVYLLGGLPFYLGWLWLFFNARRQTWHDIAASSLVVRARPT
jgi:uncharacterized RDD family membrane protein YckC